MMCPGNIFLGYIFCQRAFHLVGRVVLFCNKPQTVTYAEYMGIYCHCRLAEGHALDDVGRLAPYARQVQQQVHVRRHFAVVPFCQHPCHLHQMVSLRVRVRDTLDEFQHVVHLCLRHCPCVGVMTKQLGRHLIDALVGTLCTQYDRHQQLEHTTELQFGISHGHFLAEVIQYLLVAFFSGHRRSGWGDLFQLLKAGDVFADDVELQIHHATNLDITKVRVFEGIGDDGHLERVLRGVTHR